MDAKRTTRAIHLIARLAAGGMRDAESMLDQLLSTAHERIDEAQVRDLLGLADSEVIAAFIDHLVRGDAAAGVALLDALDERGRDVRALLDQVVEAIRLELVAGLADPGAARHHPAQLAEAGRRIAAIDPNRAGIGGLRFQLELALFRSTGDQATSIAAQPVIARPPTEPTPQPAESETEAPRPARPPPLAGRHRNGARASRRPAEAQAPAATRPAPAADRARGTGADPADARRGRRADRATDAPEAPVERETPAEPAEPPRAAEPSSLRHLGGRRIAPTSTGWRRDGRPSSHSVGPATRAVITECRPLSVEGNIVTLGFPEAKGFLKDVAERKAKELDTAVGGFLGRAVSVRCVATNIEVAAAADGCRLRPRRGEADLRRRHRRRRRGQLTVGCPTDSSPSGIAPD